MPRQALLEAGTHIRQDAGTEQKPASPQMAGGDADGQGSRDVFSCVHILHTRTKRVHWPACWKGGGATQAQPLFFEGVRRAMACLGPLPHTHTVW